MITRTVLAVVALFVLGACTAGLTTSAQTAEPTPPSTATTTATGTGTATATTAATTAATYSADVDCEDAPKDVVGAALRLRLHHVRQTIIDNVVVCSYESGAAEVRFETGADAASFADGKREHAEVIDVPDFHDEAYRATTTTGEVVQTAVVARRATIEISVVSGANVEQAKQLVTELFALL